MAVTYRPRKWMVPYKTRLTGRLISFDNEGFGVTTKEHRQREEWEAMRGTLLYAAREAMPETNQEEGEIYVADLIGMAVGSIETRNGMGYAAVGTGGAGAETVIAEVAYYLLREAGAAYVRFSAPIPVASGTRVAVKVTSSSSATAYDHKVALHYVHQAAVA